MDWQSIAAAAEKIRFGPGVVGKATVALVAMFGVLAVVAWRLIGAPLEVILALLVVALLAVGTFAWFFRRTMAFAEKHPAQALLEGIELVRWQETAVAAKNTPPAPPSARVIMTEPTREMPE